ncbi:Hypothetical protein D9617_27g045090 [Elsinoe fawcettii]|nr:Hypothetical protein D9617_27g045090 [Elsinoe fawcettii]
MPKRKHPDDGVQITIPVKKLKTDWRLGPPIHGSVEEDERMFKEEIAMLQGRSSRRATRETTREDVAEHDEQSEQDEESSEEHEEQATKTTRKRGRPRKAITYEAKKRASKKRKKGTGKDAIAIQHVDESIGFLTLPIELRLEVYGYVFENDTERAKKHDWGRVDFDNQKLTFVPKPQVDWKIDQITEVFEGAAWQLAGTCKTTRAEVLPRIYSRTTIFINFNTRNLIFPPSLPSVEWSLVTNLAISASGQELVHFLTAALPLTSWGANMTKFKLNVDGICSSPKRSLRTIDHRNRAPMTTRDEAMDALVDLLSRVRCKSGIKISMGRSRTREEQNLTAMKNAMNGGGCEISDMIRHRGKEIARNPQYESFCK